MDTGRYSSISCAVILYVVRLVVRVEGYILFLLRHDAWSKGNLLSSTAVKPKVSAWKVYSHAANDSRWLPMAPAHTSTRCSWLPMAPNA